MGIVILKIFEHFEHFCKVQIQIVCNQTASMCKTKIIPFLITCIFILLLLLSLCIVVFCILLVL